MRVQNAGIGPGQVAPLQTVTAITAAQILAMNATPVVLVPAPGANKIIWVQGLALNFIAGTFPYNGASGDQLDCFYSGQTIDLVDPSPLSGNLSVAATNYLAASAPGTTYTIAGSAAYVNLAVVLSAAQNYGGGPITALAVNAAGSGYAVNDTGHVSGGNGAGEYKVTSIGAGGAVTGLLVFAGGAGYVPATGVATTVLTGGGNGALTVNTTVGQGNGTMKVYTTYQILPNP